jgi:hypothetical protein
LKDIDIEIENRIKNLKFKKKKKENNYISLIYYKRKMHSFSGDYSSQGLL